MTQRESDRRWGDTETSPVHDDDEATVVDALEETQEEVDAIRPDGLPSPHRPRIQVLPLIAALVFFFGPAAAFLLGDRAEEIDNRPLATMPSVSRGWSFIPGFTSWANDHLPLRSHAVERGTRLSEVIFNEPPQYGQSGSGIGTGATGDGATDDAVQYPEVISGSDGWLYLGSDVSAPCQPLLSVDSIVGGLERLSTAVEESGRTLVIAVVPDKSTMVPEFLPDRYAGEQCAAERKRDFWDRVASADLRLIDMRRPLSEAQRREDDPLYRMTDSHWNQQGAYVFVEEVVAELDPGLLADESTQVVVGPEREVSGDLGGMLGTRTTDAAAEVRVERSGVTLSMGGETIEPRDIPELSSSPSVIDVSSTAAPLFPGRTAVLGDSFYSAARPLFTPFFDELLMLHNQSDAVVLAQAIVESDTVVVELVERSTVGGYMQLATPDVLDVIERELQAAPR